MGPERAATMMNLIPPIGWFELARRHDLLELEGRLINATDAKLSQLKSHLMRGFVTWLLASQATVVTVMVGLLVALR